MLATADVGLLEGAAHSDNLVPTWQLELEVGVVGDRHELGVCGAPKDGVICPLPIYHLKRGSGCVSWPCCLT